MKINLNTNRINFCKQLKANCTVLKDGKQLPCKIYELNLDDYGYFCSKENNIKWKDENLWKSVRFDFACSQSLKLSDFYVLEDKENNCLAFADISNVNFEEKGGRINLCYLASQPNRKENGYEYIGETLINFLCGLAKKNDFQSIFVKKPLDEALPFYAKCHFKIDPKCSGKEHSLILKGENLEKLTKQNEEHTKSKIDYTF